MIPTQVEWIESAKSQNIKPANIMKILKSNLIGMGQYWYLKMFPSKFAGNAGNVYHLQQRKMKYIKAMERKYGHWKPFDASGALKAAALSGCHIKADTKSNDLKVTVKIKRGHATKQWVGMELIRVLQREITDMLSTFKKGTINEINSTKKVK